MDATIKVLLEADYEAIAGAQRRSAIDGAGLHHQDVKT